MQTPSHKRIDIFYSMVGVALFVASGAVIIDRYVFILEVNNQYLRILVFWGRMQSYAVLLLVASGCHEFSKYWRTRDNLNNSKILKVHKYIVLGY